MPGLAAGQRVTETGGSGTHSVTPRAIVRLCKRGSRGAHEPLCLPHEQLAVVPKGREAPPERVPRDRLDEGVVLCEGQQGL